MGIEIDFVAVGNGTYGGDAIAVRYGNLDSNNRSDYKVIVLDGGTKASGEKLAGLIKKHYRTTRVDLVISTHPDKDHVSGLTEIFDELEVDRLWMHTPWENTEEIKHLFKDGRITDNSLKKSLQEGLEGAYEIACLASDRGIPVEEPFEGKRFDDHLIVLGPHRDYYYQELIPNFPCTPEPAQAVYKEFAAKAAEAFKWVKESLFGEEKLDDSGETSPPNNSSVVTYLEVDNYRVLFTADAGTPALNKVADYAEQEGIDLQNLSHFQVPHHGSDHNLGPSILKRLGASYALISCPPEGDPKHPSRKVVNALVRRKMGVYRTAGADLSDGTLPMRDGYRPATGLSFFEYVEA